MRVAFWWKLNWSWFCVIQSSFDEAMKPISEDEVEPFPDEDAINGVHEGEMDIDLEGVIKKEDVNGSSSPTPRSSDQDTISEPMEDIITQRMPSDIPNHLQGYWDMAKRLNRQPKWPLYLGEREWLKIGDFLVELGHELAKYGLLDMDLGLWENELMHRNLFLGLTDLGIGAVLDAWRRREMDLLRHSNEAFRRLRPEEKRVFVAAIKDDDRRRSGR
jgi:hypothetical protein